MECVVPERGSGFRGDSRSDCNVIVTDIPLQGPVTITISSTDSRRGRDKPREGTNTPSASASASTSTSAPASVAASGTNTPKKEKKPKGIGKGRPDNLLSRGTCGGEGVDTVTAQLGDVRLDTSSPAQNAIADGDKGEAIRSQGSDSV